MAVELSGSVGRSPADNREPDVILVQAFLTAYLGSVGSGAIGVAAVWQPGIYDDSLGDMIALFQRKRHLPRADGRVDKGGRTWREMVGIAGKLTIPEWINPPGPPIPETFDLNVGSFKQTILPVVSRSLAIPSIAPGSVGPYMFQRVPPTAALVEAPAIGTITELLFRIEKNGVVFWVGAAVPEGTSDFTRAYIFFHPDTIGSSDDAAYPTFTGRWPTVQRYVAEMGLQMAAAKKGMVVIVPFMTWKSKSNSAQTNLFADRGVDTINDIMTAVQMSLGQMLYFQSIEQIGVASFSSGVNHMARFAASIGSTGLIREQIDFDSAFMVSKHMQAPVLESAVNWMVTQSPPPRAGRPGWVQVSSHAFRNVPTMRNDTHSQIGNMMFQSMMVFSAIA